MGNTNNPKVLLVPAWYPASFFTEQMRLVDDAFEFKVLIGAKHDLGQKKALKKIFLGKFQQFTWIENKSISENTEIINVDYLYVNSLSSYFERRQYKYLNRCFENEFQELIKTGWKPDLIHIQSLSDTAVFICNWAEKRNIPVILTEHIIYIRRKFDFFQKEKERVYSQVNKVLCVSNYLYRNLLTNGLNISNAEVIGNLVDDSLIPEVFETIQKNNKILFVANHLHDKDIDILLEATKLLNDRNICDFFIDIVGIDPLIYYQNGNIENFNLIEVLSDYQLHNINVLGVKTRQELLRIYKEYNFLISTSLSETFGLAPAEAIINGLPVVCTDSGGPRDFIDDSNGIIVPIRDPKALGDAIVKMLHNLSNYNGKQISDEIRKRFGVKAFTESITREYRSAIYDK